MPIICSTKDGKGVIAVTGSMTAATVIEFRDELASWRQQEPDVRDFVLDLADVDLLDSAGIGVLMATLKRVTEHGGDMKIANLQSEPTAVFETTRANKVFEIFDSVDAAMASFH